MSRSPIVFVALFIGALVADGAALGGERAGGASVTGRWRIDQNLSVGFFGNQTITLRQTGTRVTGQFRWSVRAEKGFGAPGCSTGTGGTLTGTLKNRKLAARLVYPARGGHAKATMTYEASVRSDGRMLGGQVFHESGECEGIWGALWLRRAA